MQSQNSIHHSEYYSSASSSNIKTAKLSSDNREMANVVEYFSINTMNNKLLQIVLETTKEWIQSHITLSRGHLGEKSILLQYVWPGGCKLCTSRSYWGLHQALLMLSQPGVDYNGGVCSTSPRAIHRMRCMIFRLRVAGELIVFCGRKEKYLHGMTEVIPGSAGEETTKRFAVGLFH